MIRTNNQDSFGSAKNSWGELYIVADGMGGHKGGEVASKMVVDHICDAFKLGSGENDPIRLLDSIITSANQSVIATSKKDPDYEGMGTTVVAVIIKDNKAYFAHVGDSRIYLIRYKRPYFITKDHSVVQDLLDKGLISPAEAENHPQKNRILQAVGTGNVSVTITTHDLFKGDYLLLCSDGLTGEVSDSDILDIIIKQDPMPASIKLIEQANKNGGSDNSTCIVIRVDKGSNPPKEIRKTTAENGESDYSGFSYRQAILYILLGIFLTIGGNIVYNKFYKKTERTINPTPGQKFSIRMDTTMLDTTGQATADSLSIVTKVIEEASDSSKNIVDQDSTTKNAKIKEQGKTSTKDD